MIILFFSFCSIGLIIYISIKIINQPLEKTNLDYNFKIKASDREYKTWDFSMFPIFCGTMMNLFEGN